LLRLTFPRCTGSASLIRSYCDSVSSMGKNSLTDI
jgi:hypothetical protein